MSERESLFEALPCGHPKSDETSADGYTFCAVCAVQPRESGYGLLLRTVASTLAESDPGAADALRRAADEMERLVVNERLCRTVVELYGLRWAKDSHYYAAADALGMEEE